MLLPGIGPALSARIVEYRQRKGPFRSVWELGRVRGIGPVLLERIRPYVKAGGPPEPRRGGPKPVRGAVEE